MEVFVTRKKKMLLWCVLADALPTKEKLSKKLEGMEDMCVVCRDCSESSLHMFKNCPGIRALAFSNSWGGRTNDWPVANLEELWEFGFNPPSKVCKGNMNKAKFLSFMVSLFYSFWKFRNGCLFEGKHSLFDARKWLEYSMQEDIRALHFHSSFSAPVVNERWILPRQGWWKVNCDAAWVDGKAAMAMVVRDDDSLLVMACSKFSIMSSAMKQR